MSENLRAVSPSSFQYPLNSRSPIAPISTPPVNQFQSLPFQSFLPPPSPSISLLSSSIHNFSFFLLNIKIKKKRQLPSNNSRSPAQDEGTPGFAGEQKGKLEEAENYHMPIKNQPG